MKKQAISVTLWPCNLDGTGISWFWGPVWVAIRHTQTEQRVLPTSNLKLIYSWCYLLLKELTEAQSTPGGFPRCAFNAVNIHLNLGAVTSNKSTILVANYSVNLEIRNTTNITPELKIWFSCPCCKSSTARSTRGNLHKFHLSALTVLLHEDAAKLFQPLQSLMPHTPTPFPNAGYLIHCGLVNRWSLDKYSVPFCMLRWC